MSMTDNNAALHVGARRGLSGVCGVGGRGTGDERRGTRKCKYFPCGRYVLGMC